MGLADKAKDKLEEAEGRAKRTVGAATDDTSLEAEGKVEETAGNLKQAGEKVKDAIGRD
jgi:uncharacterized protein YjbJ (UPF0337 family)